MSCVTPECGFILFYPYPLSSRCQAGLEITFTSHLFTQAGAASIGDYLNIHTDAMVIIPIGFLCVCRQAHR